jgi:hypothetical protein
MTELSDHFEQFSDDELIDALEVRGGHFVVGKEDKLSYFESEELERELYERTGKFTVDCKDYDKMKEILKEQGYRVYERDPQKELLEEMYYEALCGPQARFLQYLNNLFINKIDRWI